MRALALEPRKAASADHLRGFVHENVHYSESRVGVIVLGVYHDQEGDNFQAFKEAAFGRLYPKFVWVQDAAVAAEYIGEARANELAAAKHDAVFVVSNFTDDPEGPIYQLPSEAVANTDSIVRWMDIRGTPLVWRYADGLSTLITSGKLQKFLWAFVDASSPQWVQWETALAAVAFEQRGQMKFVLVSEQAEALMQFFRIDPATLPQALIVDLHPEVGQRQFLFGKRDKTTRRWNTEAARDVTSEKLREWLAKYRAGKLKRYLRSEPAPEAGREGENNGGVFKIVGDTFEDVIRLGKDVLVNFYGDFSWCEVCKVYATEFQLIAKTLKPVKSLIVADFNMPLNDIEDHKKRGLDIAGFPDVFLFRAGEHHLPPIRFDYSKYNDERGLRAVLEFIKGHAAIEFGDKKGNKYGGKLRDEL
jgi:thiol-disulfide isomerase/thioredoxin